MTQVTISKDFNVDAQSIWAIVRQFADMDRYLPSLITSCRVLGNGLGAKRVCGTENGDILETLSSLDDEAMTLEYTIDNEDAPLPLSNYIGTAKVESLGTGKARFTWSGTFEAKGLPENEVSQILEGAYGAILDNIAENAKN